MAIDFKKKLASRTIEPKTNPIESVSYTHLDVYKRQVYPFTTVIGVRRSCAMEALSLRRSSIMAQVS